MSLDFTHEQLALREMVRDFADTVVAPRAYEQDVKHELPLDIVAQMGELGALLRDSVDAQGYPWVIVPPNLRGKMATGKGNASKDQVLQATAAKLGRVFASSDECDAWLLWQMAQHAYGLPEAIGYPQSHLDALTGVDWPTFDAWDETTWTPLTTYKPPKKKAPKRG